MNLKERAKKLKSEIPAVFLCLKDKETPIIAKITAAVTVAYALSPIDLIPDFIPILGYLDDIILLPALIALTTKLIPKNVWAKNLEKAQDIWKDGKPKKWYYGIPIVLFWLLIVWLIIKSILF
ncbi:MAG: YkvA family protein [Oscillospiraceae bacterium]